MNVAIAFLGAFLLVAPSSLGSTRGPTRSEYVEEVEPICKSETLAHRAVLQGVEGMIERGKLKQAAPHLLEAATALREAVKRIAAVPRPPADAARLARWLGFAKTGRALLQQIGRTLQKGDRSGVQKLARRLLEETKRANATVVGFDFDYCRVNPARFA